MLIQQLALHLPGLLAGGPVDNPAPSNPVSGNGIDLLISYAKYGALAACGLTGVISGGLIAFGQMSNRPEAADKGKRASYGRWPARPSSPWRIPYRPSRATP
jgi:hypothetical protein